MKSHLQTIPGDKLDKPNENRLHKPTPKHVIESTIGRSYEKPKYEIPYYENISKREPEPGTLAVRLAELMKKPEINSQINVAPGLLRRIWGRVK